jgi:Flp pilus assembly protein CpaB
MTKRALLPVLLIAAAAAAGLVGYLAGDPWAIWRKAASVCLECIGVG